MKIVRTILFIYCLAAIVAGLAAAVVALTQANQLAVEANQADLTRAEAMQWEQTTNAQLKELEKVQRREREQYTGPEAVDSSVAVQDARAVHFQAAGELEAAELALQSVEERLQRMRKLLIPILALLMLHGTVAFFFSPIRSN